MIAALFFLPAPQPAAAQGDTVADMQSYSESLAGGKVSFEMLPIPGGKVVMGSPASEASRSDDEGPQFTVTIEPFWMGKHEVTWDEFDQYAQMYHILKDQDETPVVPDDREVDAVSFPTPLWSQDALPIIERMGREGGYPAASMTQFAARQYTKWLSKKTGHFYRLPTEAEWEYACRAGAATAYHFGDDAEQLEAHGWFFDNSALDDGDGSYHKVGEKQPNAWGLHDMHGNVAEWVLDQYLADHYGKFAGKEVTWRDAVAWPDRWFPRVVRGGGWDSDAEQLRSAARLKSHMDWDMQNPQLPTSAWWHTEPFWVGFRIVRPLHEPAEAEKQRYWEPDADALRHILTTDVTKQLRALVEVEAPATQ